MKENGRVEFGLLGWKVEFYISNFSLSSPKLFQREGLQLARGENADVGVAVDTTGTIRLFYCFEKAVNPESLFFFHNVCGKCKSCVCSNFNSCRMLRQKQIESIPLNS